MNSQNDSLPEISLPKKQTLEYYDIRRIQQFLTDNGFKIDFWDLLLTDYDYRMSNGSYLNIWCSNHINDDDKYSQEQQNIFRFLQEHLGDEICIHVDW